LIDWASEGMALERAASARAPARPDLLAGSFPAQRAYILDPAPFKASFCTRRAAKSYAVGLEFLSDTWDHPRAHYLFLMTVRAQAKRDFWSDVLKAIDRQYGLGIRFNETELVATMPNGAQIYVGGADSSQEEWRKLLAGKWRKVHVDEAQAFIHMDLSRLVYETFKPAVADYRGSIGLSGTPGVLARGLFFDVTQLREKGWSVHSWLTSDNPYMADKIAAEIAELKALKPGVELTPWFRRNYLREWVIEESKLVYRYLIGRNDFDELPKYTTGDWHYVNGADLGHTDATAWVDCAYHDNDPCLYILSAEKETGLDVTAVARRTKAKMHSRDYDAMVIDNANKQAVEEMVKRHEIPWRAADKTGKSDFIEIMNGEFITGRIKLQSGSACDALRREYSDLIWDDTKDKRQEHSACENHCTDAALYAWRYCWQYLNKELPTPPQRGSMAWQQVQDEEMRAERLVALDKRQRSERGEDAWEPPQDSWTPPDFGVSFDDG